MSHPMLFSYSFPETQSTLALAIFFAAFAYEDGATVLAAALSAAGRLDARLGLLSAFLGIWIGDIGLYVLGSSLGRRAIQLHWLRRFLPTGSLEKAEAWFQKRGSMALVISRMIPGTRLPLYFAAGALGFPVRLFTTVTGICSAVWVAAIFVVWHLVPRSSHGYGKVAPWLLSAAMLLAPWLLRKPAIGGFQWVRSWYRKYRRWEFWPAWLFYPPVAAMCVWLGLRYRGFSLPTIANPSFRNGGIVGESKIEVLQALMNVAPDLVADAFLVAEGDLPARRRAVEGICREHAIGYPFVLKPNVGQRGAGFKLVASAAEVKPYLAQVRSEVVLQRYVPEPKEIGVFYYRFPGQERGEIFGVTEKVFPEVVGDGIRTFEELLRAEPRAGLIAKTYRDRFPALVGRVVPAGAHLRLVEAGNHCQGCIFRDGAHLASEALRGRLDQISNALPGFFVGRYDIRYASDDQLRRGEGFRIIELNGAASEATNIYDERNSLLSAYRTLYRQWELVYAIGAANRALGYEPASALTVWKDWTNYQTISAAYPAAD